MQKKGGVLERLRVLILLPLQADIPTENFEHGAAAESGSETNIEQRSIIALL